MKINFLLFILLITNIGFSQSRASLSSEEKEFYDNLIDAFKQNSIEKEKIDWKEFKKKVLEKALISKDSAIILALDLNGNPHTSFKYKYRRLYPSKKQYKRDSAQFKPQFIDFKKEIPEVGYLELTSLMTDPSNLQESQIKAFNYIKTLNDSIQSQDQGELKGWIIDLRNNSGGNMWPMLIALTPFYPNGTLGYFIGDKKDISWSKVNGQIWYNETSQTNKFLEKPIFYKLKNNKVKIAVLIGPRTSSSGEAVAISTKSIKNAKLFGTTSYGFATANRPVKIATDEYLIITTSVDADYNKVEYWDGIPPDFNYNDKEILNGLKAWFSATN
jgi:C-terminal processing protease CtpA/Prc